MNNNVRKHYLVQRILVLLSIGVMVSGLLLTTVFGAFNPSEAQEYVGLNVEKEEQSAELYADESIYRLEQEWYKSDKQVLWDVTTGHASVPGGNQQVVSVVLNNQKVTWANSSERVTILNLPDSWKKGTELSSYYPNATKNREQTVSAIITPADGYYVVSVVVACTAESTGGAVLSSPYNCGTWNADNAYTKNFTVGTGGAVTFDLPSSAFGHSSNISPYTTDDGGSPYDESAYFILIKVAPLPSPLYVEYNYGDIVSNMTDNSQKTVFTGSSSTWLTMGTGNDYGTGEVQTLNTQYMHSYPAGLTDEQEAAAAAAWRHYACAITPEAHAAALQAGYVFAGWKAEYFTDCEASDVDSGTNNYTYSFSGEYATSNYAPGDQVSLPTHVKLIAQWKKVETGSVKVSKVVVGDAPNKDTFTFVATLFNGDVQIAFPASAALSGAISQSLSGDTWSFALQDKGEASFSGLPVGTVLKVIETENSDYVTTISPVDAQQTIEANITKEIAFTNTYAPKTGNLIIKKTVVNQLYAGEESFFFTITAGDDVDAEQLAAWAKENGVVLSNNGFEVTLVVGESRVAERTLTGLPIGSYTVQEKNVHDKYFVSGGGGVTIMADETASINIINTLKTTFVTLDKEVKGNMGDRAKNFSFIVRINGVEVRRVELNHYSEIVTIDGIPVGSTVEIIEESGDYQVSATVNGQEVIVTNGAVVIEQIDQDGCAVKFINRKDVTIDTGVILDSIPYILILGVVAVAAVVLVLRKRRGDED